MKRFGFAFLVMGFTDLIQVLLIREFIIIFQGNELSLGVILANWMLLMALGSWQLGKLADRLSQRATVFTVTQILVAIVLPLEVLFARSINNLVGIKTGEVVGLFPIFYCSLFVLAPIGILHGFQFALGSKILSAESQAPAVEVGKVYIFEAIGTMVSGIVFTYLLVRFLHPLEIAILVSLLSLFSALLLLKPEGIAWRSGAGWRAKFMVCLVILAFGAGLLSLVTGGIDRLHEISARWQWMGHRLVYYQNSVYGNISVTQRAEQFTFYESGLPMFSVPNPDVAFNEEVIHFPMLYHPSPHKVLLIGGGIGGTLDELLKHPIEQVHYAELDPLIIEAAKQYSPGSFVSALDDPRVNIKYVDGRFFIKNTHETYDVVIVTLPSPSTLQLNRLYTVEFFDDVANILKPGGVFSTIVPSSETYLSSEMIKHNRCIYDTLKQVFNSVVIIPGDLNIFVAFSDEQLLGQDTATLCHRFDTRELETKLLTANYIRYKLNPVRTERLLAPILTSNKVPVNRDLHPIGCYYNLALWNAMFHSGAAGFFDWTSHMRLWWFAIPSGVLVLLATGVVLRRKATKPRLLAVVVAIIITGLAGMTLSIILLLALQTLQGYLYERLAIIIASFMLGLALGGAYMNRIVYKIRREILFLATLEIIIVAYSIFVAFILVLLFAGAARLPSFIPPEVFLSLLNCAAGFLVGLEFPLANRIYLEVNERVGQVAGSLYAGDLLGGCLGAILASVFLVPILGIPQTCFVLAMLNAAGFTLLLFTAFIPRLKP